MKHIKLVRSTLVLMLLISNFGFKVYAEMGNDQVPPIIAGGPMALNELQIQNLQNLGLRPRDINRLNGNIYDNFLIARAIEGVRVHIAIEAVQENVNFDRFQDAMGIDGVHDEYALAVAIRDHNFFERFQEAIAVGVADWHALDAARRMVPEEDFQDVLLHLPVLLRH